MLALLGFAAAQYGDGSGVVTSPGSQQEYTIIYSLSGIIRLDGHACVFRDGELRLTGPILGIGDRGDFTIEAGFATTESGNRIHIDSGSFDVRVLASTDRQALLNALSGTGITLDQFIQQTGTIPPQNGVFEVLSGFVFINGVYYQVDVGVVVVLSSVQAGSSGSGVVQPGGGQTRTEFVTAAPQTTSVVESVTLTKFSTEDVFVTVTAPLYNSYDATVTNFVKQTKNVAEDQVIRSPAAGNVVVNTITVQSQRVVNVRDTKTNFYVQTIVGDAISTLQHVATNFAFSTVTIDVPATTHVTQTIVRTSVATAYVTTTVGSTIYTTSTVVISQGPATQTNGY